MALQLDVTDEETRALLNLLVEAIEADRYPYSPRIRVLREIPTKLGPAKPTEPLPPPLRRRTGGPPATALNPRAGAPVYELLNPG